MDVNVKNTSRGLTSNSSNPNDKTSAGTRPKGQHRRNRDPRGGHDAGSVSGYNDNPRKFKGFGGGNRKHHQQRFQPQEKTAMSSSSKPSQSEFNAEVMKEDEFEVGSVFNAGSKKQNLNHLLNFQFEPRGTRDKKRNNSHQGSGSRVRKFSDSRGRPKYNKEQYLQAK